MAESEKIPVTVVVPPRGEEFSGYWCIGRKFDQGRTDLEVTPAQLADIKADEARGMPIAVVEFSPIEQAQRRAAVADAEARAAEADAQRALEEAEKKAQAAKAAKAELDAAASKADGGKGKR